MRLKNPVMSYAEKSGHESLVKYKTNWGVRMERIPNGKYTREFREEAVKLVTEGGLLIPEAGRRLSLPSSTLNTWVKAYKTGKLGDLMFLENYFYWKI